MAWPTVVGATAPGFPIAATTWVASAMRGVNSVTSTSITASSSMIGYLLRSHATGARNNNCFCPLSASTITNGGIGGSAIVSRRYAI